jgi:hypothetical protein
MLVLAVLVNGAGTGPVWAAEAPRTRLISLSDRATLVVEVPQASRHAVGRPDTEALVVEIELPLDDFVAVAREPPTPSPFLRRVMLTPARRSDGARALRVTIMKGPDTTCRVRLAGGRLYVDVVSASRPLISSGPSGDTPPVIPTKDSYSTLRQEILDRASTLAIRPDVRGLLRLEAEIHARDERLGRSQPDLIEELLLQVKQFTEAARTRQLDEDKRALLKQSAKP